jgi:hypothetical protein
MTTPMRSTASSQSRLLSIPCSTLLTPAALQERVGHILRHDPRLARSFVPGQDAFGFTVQGADQTTGIRFTVSPLADSVNHVDVSFHRTDASRAGRILDQLFGWNSRTPDFVEDVRLEVLLAASPNDTSAWPLLAA